MSSGSLRPGSINWLIAVDLAFWTIDDDRDLDDPVPLGVDPGGFGVDGDEAIERARCRRWARRARQGLPRLATQRLTRMDRTSVRIILQYH